MSDQDVAQMACAWPNLTYIHISNEYISRYARSPSLGRTQCPSLGGVVSFVQQCHRLEALALNVADATEEELTELEQRAQAMSPAPHHPLSLLLLAASEEEWEHVTIYDTQRLAFALRRLFPRIGGTGSMGDDHPFLKRLQPPWLFGRAMSAVYELLAKLDALREEAICK